MQVEEPHRLVEDNSRWTPAGLSARDDWIVPLDQAARAEIAQAMQSARRRSCPAELITARDFPLPDLSKRLRRMRELLSDGPGVVLLRGLPVGQYSLDELKLVLWGIGAHLGQGVSQSYRGDMIGEVMDMSHTGDTRRSYRSPRPLDLHVDPVDVVGLLCVRRAKAGGTSLLTSSAALHNAILEARPDLLPYLYRGYRYRHSEAASTGEHPTTPHRIPVFGQVAGSFICNFNASPIARAMAEGDVDAEPAAREAFEVFRATAAREDLLYRSMLEPGDLQFLNNRKVLHGRTEFEDVADLDRKRLMLRLWLRMPDWPALPADMKLRGGEGIAKQPLATDERRGID